MENLSGDVLREIGLKLSLTDIHNYCLTNSKFNSQVCQKTYFWRSKLLQDYNYRSVSNNLEELQLEYFWLNKLKKDFEFGYGGENNLKSIKKYYNKIKILPIKFKIEEAAILGDEELTDKLVNSFDGDVKWMFAYIGSIKGGHRKLIEKYINKTDVSRIKHGLKPAAKNYDRELIELLISKGVNNWDSGLTGAAKGGHKDLVDFFIEKGANNWSRGLFGAAEGGHRDLVDFFIEKGAIITSGDLIGALEHKDIKDNCEIIKLFLKRGANIDLAIERVPPGLSHVVHRLKELKNIPDLNC